MRLGTMCHRDKLVSFHQLNVDLSLAICHASNCGKVADRAWLVGDIQAGKPKAQLANGSDVWQSVAAALITGKNVVWCHGGVD